MAQSLALGMLVEKHLQEDRMPITAFVDLENQEKAYERTDEKAYRRLRRYVMVGVS